MYKKVMFLVVALSLALSACAPVADVVVSSPVVMSLGESAGQYALTDMNMIVDGIMGVYEGMPYTLSMYNPKTQEYFMAWKVTTNLFAGDQAAFAFYSPKGDVDFSSKYVNARNLLDVVTKLTQEGWVRSPSNYLVPPAVAEFLRFLGSAGQLSISVFIVPAIWTDFSIVPEAVLTDT